MSTIDDLKNKVIRLEDQLRDAREKYNSALIDAFPIKIGEVWRYTGPWHRKDGHRGQVTSFRTSYGTTYAVLTLFKKDGSLGLRTDQISEFGIKEWTREEPSK